MDNNVLFEALSNQVPSVLRGHRAYLDSLGRITECMRMLTQNEGAVTGVSRPRMVNMLRAVFVHQNEGCRECDRRKPSFLQSINAFLSAYQGYANSAHYESSSGLQHISIGLPAFVAELPALADIVTALEERARSKPSHQPPAAEATQPSP
jgi:hypothetical protein